MKSDSRKFTHFAICQCIPFFVRYELFPKVSSSVFNYSLNIRKITGLLSSTSDTSILLIPDNNEMLVRKKQNQQKNIKTKQSLEMYCNEYCAPASHLHKTILMF